MVFRGTRDCCVNIENKSTDPDVKVKQTELTQFCWSIINQRSLGDAQQPETTFDMQDSNSSQWRMDV